MNRSRGDTLVSQTGLATSYSYDLCLDQIDGCAIQVVYTDATPAAKTFVDGDVDVSANTITKASHGFVSGLKVAATTDGVLPGGLSATNYYVIVVSSSVFKLASSLANAVAGTAVDITSAAGGGTHTLTPASLGGVVVKLQRSNDGTNFDDHASHTVTISAAGNKVWELVDPFYRYVRILHTPSAGAVNLTATLNAKTREP
jgi:hypothetical protein